MHEVPNSNQEPAVPPAVFLAAYDRVVLSLASKSVFGYLDVDDIKQEIYILCVDAMPRFQPSRASGKDLETQLANLFFSHCKNKLVNMRRDMFHRTDSPCARCASGEFCTPGGCDLFTSWRIRNGSKSALCMSAVGVDDDDAHQHTPSIDADDPASRELMARFEAEIPADLRTDWLRLKAGAKVAKGRRGKLLARLKSIFNNVGFADLENEDGLEDSASSPSPLCGDEADVGGESHGEA